MAVERIYCGLVEETQPCAPGTQTAKRRRPHGRQWLLFLCALYALKFIKYIRIKSVYLISEPLILSADTPPPSHGSPCEARNIKIETVSSLCLSLCSPAGSPAFPQFKAYFKLYLFFPCSLFLLDNVHVIMKINSDGAALWRDGCVRGRPPAPRLLILWE